MIRRMRADEAGSAMITALLATTMMLALGLAMLAIVDTQADQSAQERTHDRAFNFGESVLTSEAFVLGRNWPEQAPAGGTLRCYPDAAGIGDPGFGAPLGDAGSTDAVKRLVRNLNESYDPARDGAYTGASWKVNVCDDSDPDGGGPLAIQRCGTTRSSPTPTGTRTTTAQAIRRVTAGCGCGPRRLWATRPAFSPVSWPSAPLRP